MELSQWGYLSNHPFYFRNFHYKPSIFGVAQFWNPQFTLSILDGYKILVLDVIILFWLQMAVNESYILTFFSFCSVFSRTWVFSQQWQLIQEEAGDNQKIGMLT